VAEILGVTQSAISQYMKNIRGKEFLERREEFKKAFKEMCEEIMKGESFESVVCKFCKRFF